MSICGIYCGTGVTGVTSVGFILSFFFNLKKLIYLFIFFFTKGKATFLLFFSPQVQTSVSGK